MKTYDLAADLEYTLMNIDLLGMHYKVHILEFLKTHNRLPIIKKYIYALYGEDGTKIFLNENVVEMHQIFSPYGMLVAPDIMKAVSQKIKFFDQIDGLDHLREIVLSKVWCTSKD